jgi:hypothetical protein
MSEGITIAYVAQGRLYIKAPDQLPAELSCQFTQRAMDRARHDQERHGWKSRSEPGSMMMSSQLLWRTAQAQGISRVQISSVAPGKNSEVLFTLNTNSVGGIFAHNASDQSERRLYHKNGFHAQYLARHPTEDLVALSVTGTNGETHIAVTDTEGKHLREVTEGDSIDECPSWVPGEKKLLVFQSAGIGRNAYGFPTGNGPYRIEKLDLDAGGMTTLIDDPLFDQLNPKIDHKGRLYFIRRPYSPHARTIPWTTRVTDVIFFPFRLIWAFIQFFNFFSLTFAGKTLLTGGPPTAPQDAKVMMLWGKVIDAEKALKAMKTGDAPALVPSNWQLIRLDAGGSEEILANSVGSFDIAPDDSIVFTNGAGIFRLGDDGSQTKLCGDRLIELVRCWRTI